MFNSDLSVVTALALSFSSSGITPTVLLLDLFWPWQRPIRAALYYSILSEAETCAHFKLRSVLVNGLHHSKKNKTPPLIFVILVNHLHSNENYACL